MAFHVGQSVLCIDDKAQITIAGEKPVKSGETYTIRRIHPDVRDGMHGLYLEEIVNPHNPFLDEENCYKSCRFRPIQEQGMSILRAILADPKVKIKETA